MFAESYADARRAFHAAVEKAGGSVESLVNPHASGPDGERLTMDIGWIGPRDAARLLISISGTHGLEGYGGGGAMLALLANMPALPPGLALMLVHGNNAYGWAHSSRANENNVDLNRNMVDFSRPLAENPLYARLVHPLFCPEALPGDLTAWMADGLAARYAEHGLDATVNAINQGQFDHPDGVYYGGAQTEWSTATLRAVVDRHAARARLVACIDWHSGIGDYGQPYFLCFHDAGSAARERAETWWGRDAVNVADGFGGAERPRYQGLVVDDIARRLEAAGVRTTAAVIEWGTRANEQAEAAVMADRALRFGNVPPDRRAALAEFARDGFGPREQAWCESVEQHAVAIYSKTIAGLADG